MGGKASSLRAGAEAYRAFISYSHAADGRLAPALQSALQSFAKPWYQLRAMRVFRDKTSLSADPALWTAIERALQRSDWFLLMASPDSAGSQWVEQEVLWWLEHRSAKRMLIVLTEGDLAWDDGSSDFDWNRTSALGHYLSGRIESEPLYVDLRWARTADKLSLRNNQFRAVVLDLAAPLHGRPKDELDGEDIRQHRRTRRVAWTGGIALVLLTVIAIIAAGVAVNQARLAEQRLLEVEKERNIAVARQLAAQSEILRGQSTRLLPTSLLLAVESLQRSFSLEAVQSLQRGLQLLLPKLDAVTVQHSENVNDAVLTPEGDFLITASDDGTARVWEAATGIQRALLDVGERVLELHLSRDGKRLATMAYASRSVRVWDVDTGSEIGRFDHAVPVEAAAISPDGSEIATGARDGLLRIWDVASGVERLQLAHQSWVVALAFSPDGRRIVSGSPDRLTRLWELANGTELWRFEHLERVVTVAFSPSGKLVATGGWDQRARVLNASNGQERASVLHAAVVSKVAFSAESLSLLSASDDGTVRMVHATSGEQIAGFRPEGGVTNFALSVDGRFLATNGLSLAVQVWEVETEREVARIPVGGLPMNVRFGPQGSTLLISARDHTARALQLHSASTLRHGKALHAAAFSSNGRFAATAPGKRSVNVIDLEGGAPKLLTISEDVDRLLIAPEGQLLITQNTWGRTVQGWGTADGRALWKIENTTDDSLHMLPSNLSPDGRYLTVEYSQARELDIVEAVTGQIVGKAAHDKLIMDSAFSPDGRLLVTMGDTSARVWETEGGKLVHNIRLDGDARRVCFSIDGRRFVTTSADGLARLWDVTTGSELHRFGGDQSLGAVALSPDGKILAAVSFGGTVRLWRVETGEEISRLIHDGSVDFIAFSPDGKYLASGSRDHSARVWDVERAAEVARMTDLAEAFSVAFDATGRYLLVEHAYTSENRWRIWLWRPSDLEAQVCASLDHNLGRSDWLRYFGSEPYQLTCPQLPEGN